ncbi:uncharacterized protein LOC117171811 isoform X2 [Belonocnema kinseyi]|uniref:uncharacterized protein LOC117171811 isoform X2 n=1 Tax=Belonocnema kinseyi TaxID=2817044 RepID=UPI00143D6C89|nr:uncharacterized protein LOC117171811 isoform X2 [Belonocnema kinseyi]
MDSKNKETHQKFLQYEKEKRVYRSLFNFKNMALQDENPVNDKHVDDKLYSAKESESHVNTKKSDIPKRSSGENSRDGKCHDQRPSRSSISQSSIYDNEEKHEKPQLGDGEKSRKQKYDNEQHYSAKDSKSHINAEKATFLSVAVGKV